MTLDLAKGLVGWERERKGSRTALRGPTKSCPGLVCWAADPRQTWLRMHTEQLPVPRHLWIIFCLLI